MTTLTDLKAQLEQARQEMSEAEAKWNAFEKEHEAVFVARGELRQAYLNASAAMRGLIEAVKKEARAQQRASFQVPADARAFLDVVADESVTGSFEGWRFASKRKGGVELKLNRFGGIPYIHLEEKVYHWPGTSVTTWEALRLDLAGDYRFKTDWRGSSHYDSVSTTNVVTGKRFPSNILNLACWKP